MPDYENIASALGLEDDASEATILDRIQAIRPPEDGQVILSADEAAELMRKAAEGENAVKALAEDRFTAAWDKALSGGRAVPAQRDLFRRLYDQDADLAVKTLDALSPAVPVETVGVGENDVTTPEDVGGQDPDRVRLDQAAQAYAKDNNVSYLDALEVVAEKVLGGAE